MELSNMHRFAVFALAVGGVILAYASPVSSQERKKTTVGRVEKVWIGDANVVLRAKIDTGARTTSLGADNIEFFQRRGRDWVRFSFADEKGATVTLERKLVHFKRLKKTNTPGPEDRPVVRLRLCVADVYRLTQVNLADRQELNYPLLIGRRFLFGKAMVDVARIYTAEPHCPEMTSPR